MSTLQKMDGSANRFSSVMLDRSKRASGWAKNLKMGTAVRNLIISPFYFVPWLVGRLFYFLKWSIGFLWVAFRTGAKME